jgi:hypothetical protein
MLIGHSLWAQRQYREAKQYYEKCFHKDKGCALPVIRLAELAIQDKDFAGAEHILKEFLKLKPFFLKAIALKTKIKFVKSGNFNT